MCAMPLAAPPLRTNPIFCCVKPVKKENKRMITDPIFTFPKGISFSKRGAVNNALKNQIEKFIVKSRSWVDSRTEWIVTSAWSVPWYRQSASSFLSPQAWMVANPHGAHRLELHFAKNDSTNVALWPSLCFLHIQLFALGLRGFQRECRGQILTCASSQLSKCRYVEFLHNCRCCLCTLLRELRHHRLNELVCLSLQRSRYQDEREKLLL